MYFTKVQFWGHSHIITLPQNLRKVIGLKKGDWLFVTIEKGDIIQMRKVEMTTRTKGIREGKENGE